MRQLWLDLFRGIAAIAVIGYHFRDYLGIPWMGFGYVSVEVFFVLSGLILGLKYAQSIEAGMGFWKFAKARLLRLYPMVAIAGLFILTLNVAGAPTNPYVGGVAASPLDVFLLTSFTWSGAYAPGWPADSPIWSLWAELACNVIWFWSLRAGRSTANVIGVLAMIATLAFAQRYEFLGKGTDAGWLERLVSVLSATAWFTVGYAMAVFRIRPIASAKVMLGVLAAALVVYKLHVLSVFLSGLLLVVACVLLLNTLYQMPPPSRMLGRIAAWLGALSYPLYLIHAPAGRLLAHTDHMVYRWSSLVVCIGVSGLVATMMNEWLMRIVHRVTRPLKPPAALPAEN